MTRSKSRATQGETSSPMPDLPNMPEGPNVGPSAHEHEAAQGQVQAQEPVEQQGLATDQQQETGTDGAQGGDREQRIRDAAYAMAARRGFESGHDVDDWLEAERQHDGAAAPDRPA